MAEWIFVIKKVSLLMPIAVFILYRAVGFLDKRLPVCVTVETVSVGKQWYIYLVLDNNPIINLKQISLNML